MMKTRAMRPTFRNNKINRHLVRDWTYWQEECRRNMAAEVGRRTAASEKNEGATEPDPEWVGMMGREVPAWFLSNKKERMDHTFKLTAENVLELVWDAYHNGYRYGRKTAGAADNKVPGMPRG